ncbi:MAG TPA: vanadium-dependent haloperoxidase [Steroidobacteraceae bacterium]|nr:vanadium-dependent haloperoxidase [Steroidobacteraceae bacterium]
MKMPIVAAVAVCGALISSTALSSTDPVLEWNAIMLNTVASTNPFFQARFAAITQLAVFESVNAIDKDYEPYLGTIKPPPGASAEAAAVAAAHKVLENYFPADSNALDNAFNASLDGIADRGKQDGIAFGEQVAQTIIDLRADDGSAPPQSYEPTSSAAGEWQPTPSCPPTGGILLQWGNLRPFAIKSTDEFRSEPPPALTSERYQRSYDEVMRVGSIDSAFRPQDRADVARFYAAVTPVEAWNSAAAQVAVEQGRSMSENARAFALMNMAIADASASVFETKYFYHRWRPETAIHAAGDVAWMPYIVAPCFPSYSAAHGSLSGAARTVLERLYGPRHHLIVLSNPLVPGVVLQYSTFEEITHDISDARVYGGIHFRYDMEEGARQGRRVGKYVYRHKLRPANGDGDGNDAGRDDGH